MKMFYDATIDGELEMREARNRWRQQAIYNLYEENMFLQKIGINTKQEDLTTKSDAHE